MTASASDMAPLRHALETALKALDNEGPAVAPAVSTDLHQRARECLKQMAARAKIIDPPLCEGCWAILLDLFVNQDARRISISSACIASGNPPTTALRWIRQMEASGLLCRKNDGADGRRVFLELTPRARDAVLQYLQC